MLLSYYRQYDPARANAESINQVFLYFRQTAGAEDWVELMCTKLDGKYGADPRDSLVELEALLGGGGEFMGPRSAEEEVSGAVEEETAIHRFTAFHWLPPVLSAVLFTALPLPFHCPFHCLSLPFHCPFHRPFHCLSTALPPSFPPSFSLPFHCPSTVFSTVLFTAFHCPSTVLSTAFP